MRKKILPAEFRVYPLDQSLQKKWFVQGYDDNKKKVKFAIPDAPTVKKRLAFAEDILHRLRTKGVEDFKRAERKEIFANYVVAAFYDILEEKKAWLRKKSYQSYLSHLRNFSYYLEAKLCKRITEDVARDFLLYLKAKGISNTTINAHRLTLTHFYSEMIKRKQIKSNPFKATTKLRENREGACYLTLRMIEKYKSYVLEHKPFMWLPSILQFYCFIRPTEMRFLQIADIDLRKKLIRVNAKIAKNGKTEFVKIPNPLLPYLEDLELEFYPDNYYLFGINGRPSPKPVSYNFWGYHFREIRKALKFPDKYVFYSFKHAGAANYMENTGDIVGLQRQMRHHSAEITSIYLKSIGIEDLERLKTGFSDL